MESKESKSADLDISFEDGESFDDEVNYEASGNDEDNEFDFMVGALQEIIFDESFTNIQNSFCSANCDIFEDSDENKFEYTDIFQSYTSLIETSLENRMKEKIPGFLMSRFETLLSNRQDEIGGEIFDLLMSFGDFVEFKDIMLSYKRSKLAASLEDGSMLVFNFRSNSAGSKNKDS